MSLSLVSQHLIQGPKFLPQQTSSSFLGWVRGRSAKHGFGGMGFWVQSEGKGSWSDDSLVGGRGATWEKKARELGGVLSLNQKRKGDLEKKRKKGSICE